MQRQNSLVLNTANHNKNNNGNKRTNINYLNYCFIEIGQNTEKSLGDLRRQECASFQTSQRLTDKVWAIIKKRYFSDFEILEIHKETNNEQDSNIISDTPSIDK